MVGKTAPIRRHDAERMERIHLYCGCLPCLISGVSDVPTTVEHVTEAGRRIEGEEQHQWTIGLCEYHHFGTGPERWGRSLAHGRKGFEADFGDEVEVLVATQDFMLELFDRQPWLEYAVPRQVAKRVRTFWLNQYAGPSQFTVRS